MSMVGFVEEDDLILYAMQALSAAEMDGIAHRLETEPQLARRLAEIQAVLGLYASATTELQPVPSAALDRLQRAVSAGRPVAATRPMGHTAASVAESKPSWGARLGLLWAGWAVAAMLLVGLALQYGQNRRVRQTVAATDSTLQTAQTEARNLLAERDRLQASLQQQSEQAQASRHEASVAQSHSADLDARVAEAKLRAEREAARADGLAAAAHQSAEDRNALNAALAREQQEAAKASESQQVLAALADPTALHVTLTVPKQKKLPSGRGTYLASNGTLVFTGSDLSPLPAGKVYELWLMPADGSAPIPAGTFTPDAAGNATVIASHFQQVPAKGFAITAERTGGSPTPTLPILLAGSA